MDMKNQGTDNLRTWKTVGAREPESLESKEPEDHESSWDPRKPENRYEPKEFKNLRRKKPRSCYVERETGEHSSPENGMNQK